MAAILDMVAILKKITKNLKKKKDLPHQLFQKVLTSNMLFISLGLSQALQTSLSGPDLTVTGLAGTSAVPWPSLAHTLCHLNHGV